MDSPEDFGRFLAQRARFWSNARIAPESNNFGRSCIVAIHDSGYPYIANDVRWTGQMFTPHSDLGITVTEPLRRMMLSDHKRQFEDFGLIVNSRTQLKEMRSMTRKGIRWEGYPHDDLLFADLHCVFVQSMGTARGRMIG